MNPPKISGTKTLPEKDEEVGELPEEIHANAPQVSAEEILSLLEKLLARRTRQALARRLHAP